MCADLLRKWLVLVVCTCGSTAAAEPNEPVAEVNEPWIVAEHLAPFWGSMTLKTQLYNHEIPADRPRPPRRSLSFEGYLNVIDPNGLVGLSQVATNVNVFDEIRIPIQVESVAETTVDCECRVHGPSYQPLELKTKYFSFTIDMSMAYNAPFPVVLSRFEWSMSALLSDHFEAIDIPFAPTADWTELVPGLEVLVEQATVEQGKYSYRMKARYDPNRLTYLDVRDKGPCPIGPTDVSYSWRWHAYPEMIVTAIDVLDAEHNSVFAWSSGQLVLLNGHTSSKDSGGQTIATRLPTGTCSECGKAAFIRHIIAFKPYDQKLQFVLENVPVPTE